MGAVQGGMDRIFPDREVVESPDDDPIFRAAYNLNEWYHVKNFRSMMRRAASRTGRTGSDGAQFRFEGLVAR